MLLLEFFGRQLVRQRLFAFLLSLLLLFSSGCKMMDDAFGKKDSRLNVVLIDIDSLRADHLGSYGYDKNTSPFLDSLSERGALFNNCYSPSPWTFSSHASIFTGVFPSQHNKIDWEITLNNKFYALPEILNAFGYGTSAIISSGGIEEQWYKETFDNLISFPLSTDVKTELSYTKNVSDSKWAVKEEMERISNDGKPFFVFWHIYDVHLPYDFPTKEFYSGSDNLVDGTYSFRYQRRNALGIMRYPFVDPVPTEFYSWSSSDRESIIASYDSGIKRTDKELQSFFAMVETQPFFDNTLFIITSSHGEDLGEHGFFFHGDSYNNNLHVPLIFYREGMIPFSFDSYVSSMDIFYTVLHQLDIIAPNNISTKQDLLFTSELELDRYIFSERVPMREYVVLHDGWKYILRNPNKFDDQWRKNSGISDFMVDILDFDSEPTNILDELYNIVDDPQEQNNLIDDVTNGGIKRDLYFRVTAFADEMMRSSDDQKSTNKIFTYP